MYESKPVSLFRLLIVAPWTQRHFSTLGNLSTSSAIMGNVQVVIHGKLIMNGLDRAVKNLDNIKQVYAPLSVMHSEKLHVDPDNFRVSSMNSLFVSEIPLLESFWCIR